MPFVQRVVSPTFISRSRPRSRVRGGGAARPVSPAPSKGTSAGSHGGSGPLLNGTGNTGSEPSSSSSDVIVNGGTISGVASITGKSGSGSSLVGPVHSSSPVVNGYEFDSVTNITLSNALRQLASLVLIANDIFTELNRELQTIGDRSKGIKQRIDTIERKVAECDPKLVTVPESDLETFVHIKNHFKSNRPIDKELFTPKSRSTNLRELYEAAAKTPISSLRDTSGSLIIDRDDELLCTPVLGQTHRKMRTRVDVEIETRMPAAVEELRKWTSTEALGDITVTPDCISRVGHNTSMNNSTFCNSNTNGYQSNVSVGTQPGVSIDVTDDNSTVIATTQHASNTTNNNTNRTTNEDVDLPLDHRLPSPEEQCQIIALKYPADVITVDITGRRFERMCNARKSMTNYMAIGDHNNLSEDVQTVKRRSRSRKPRGKRRNTIAGTDQKEIEEAANGELASNSSPTTELAAAAASSKVGRSKSSDILKKDSPLSLQNSLENGKTTLTRFNSLKQWGRNRLRLINRSDDKKDKVLDVDHENNVYETVVSKNKKKFAEKERKLSHERKPSYSSSEKSNLSLMSHSIKAPANATASAASINPVKMRESSSLRRQRRTGLDHKDEPHSSSGNWSASSESGRTSIGSEITVQPKSSASSTSLNHSNLHSGSGPPSSIISRRRFLNTSASSSVTSEGTATPDLQMHDLYYDDETSSAYSCDTEGYYTSFHVDSGLKTLKEEEPMTPLHSTSALSSNNSFSSSINQTVLTAENEYELFGRGSTSTTTSSAGTVCTTLMAVDNDKSSIHGPAVPERKSSLTKLNRSNSNTSTSTLERSYSSSTVGSTLERTGTIKRNGVLLQKEVAAVIHQERNEPPAKPTRIESPDSGNNTSSSPIESNSNESPTQGLRSNSEFEYSECSDLEGVDRIERIRVKTAINSSRIPSMCIITPTTSDDETMKDFVVRSRERLELPTTPPPQETDLDAIEYEIDASNNGNQQKVQILSVNKPAASAGYATVHHHHHQHPAQLESQKPAVELRKDANFNNFRKTTLQPLNTMLGKLKGVLPHLKKSPNKEATTITPESLYDTAGEYVTIADVRNNNNNQNHHLKQRTSNGIYYSNDIVKRNLATVLSGNLNQETEYVSLNELPCNIRCDSTTPSMAGNMLPASQHHHQQGILAPTTDEIDTKIQRDAAASRFEGGELGTNTPKSHDRDGDEQQKQQQQVRGARVQFDAQGKVVYNSDSLKRRKGAHTTFVPGPCVKDPAISALSASVVVPSSSESVVTPSPVATTLIPRSPLISGCLSRKQEIVVRPVVSQKPQIVATAASNNVDMMTTGGVVSGRYIRDKSQQQQSLENGNIIIGNSAVPSLPNVYHRPQFEEDYQRLSHNERPVQYETSKSPRANLTQGRYSSSTGPTLPFQRNNHIYWTLQHRRQPVTSSTQPKDDMNVVAKSNIVNLDELYATPHKNRTRETGLKTTPLGFSTFFSPIKTAENEPLKISPIDPRNLGGFKTSTPSKLISNRTESPTKVSLADELRHRLHIQEGTRSHNASPTSSGRSTPLRGYLEQQPRSRHSWAPETPELPKTCSDRLGTQKTSLMDFKKLLLAKSSKHTPNAKLSAVELLKLNKNEAAAAAASSPSPSPVLNTSMNILELSGSPKTFANRRALRQGNFGSPSKTLGSKQRTAWRMNASRTDVMSTAIPEANSEEDSSSSNGSMGRRSPNPTNVMPSVPEKSIIDDNLNLKTNIFLQSEENNFMRGELKTPNTLGISRTQLAQARAQFLMGTKSFSPSKEPISESYRPIVPAKRIEDSTTTATITTLTTNDPTNSTTINDDSNKGIKNNNAAAAPSLETAL